MPSPSAGHGIERKAAMRILRQEDYKTMPWKNGGGITTEVWASPEGSGLAGAPFDWRVSIADVATDGPFSKFAGYDRHIMLLEGEGMRLETEESGIIDLSLYRPAALSGDWTVTGKLIAGPVRDLNLLIARRFGRGSLTCQRLTAPLPLLGDGAMRLVQAIDGELSLGGHIIGQGETAILAEMETGVLSPLAAEALFALCSVHYQGQASRI
jgi:environmental stress-induced protein Ves